MSLSTWIAPALLACLAACAGPDGARPDFAAKNRPLEERCARAQSTRSENKPGLTREEVEAQARAATRRGELDGACGWL